VKGSEIGVRKRKKERTHSWLNGTVAVIFAMTRRRRRNAGHDPKIYNPIEPSQLGHPVRRDVISSAYAALIKHHHLTAPLSLTTPSGDTGENE
jgi:hypothetical protein